MKTHITNNENVSLLLAVWLATNEYNISDDPKVISATTLLKPLRQIVLAKQNMGADKTMDVMAMVPSRMGTAIHDSVEKSWENIDNVKEIIKSMGISTDIVDRIVINPEGVVPDDAIPIYIEQRKEKAINGWTISGAFDEVMDGRVYDIKITSVWTHIFVSNDLKYIKQGSIYRCINPKLITDELLQIEHIFTDWSGVKARADAKYPQARILSKQLELMSVVDTHKFITDKLKSIDKYMLITDQSKIPECTDEELLREADKYKYYAPKKDGTISYVRATKVFDDYELAYAHKLAKGTGEVIEVKGGVKACKYCAVRELCDQHKELKVTGQIKE